MILNLALSVDPEHGAADSGALENDLPNLFVAIGEAARSSGRPFALLIDELQYLSETEFSALIMFMHQVNSTKFAYNIDWSWTSADPWIGRGIEILFGKTF